jgi:hypothetical protein
MAQSMTTFSESTVEDAALEWLRATGWQIAHGPDIAPGMLTAERADYGEVVLARRLRDALERLNPRLPAEALDDAFRKLTRPEGAELLQRNREHDATFLEERLTWKTANSPGSPISSGALPTMSCATCTCAASTATSSSP